MANTVVGIFENRKEAIKAIDTLLYNGFERNDIDLSSDGASEYRTSSTDTEYHTSASDTDRTERKDRTNEDGITKFFNSLFGSGEHADRHSEVGRRGTIVTVHSDTKEEAERASSILDEYGSVDVEERASYYRSDEYRDRPDRTEVDTTTDVKNEDSIPVVEEEMQTGKREVDTGGVRIRSRIVERPVEEHLRLRSEHVHVERKPTDRPATEADFQNFKEGEVEMKERSEEAVTSKEARVKEEVKVRKDVEERDETIHDTVRGTEVETEDLSNRNIDTTRKGTTDYTNERKESYVKGDYENMTEEERRLYNERRKEDLNNMTEEQRRQFDERNANLTEEERARRERERGNL